MQKFFLKYSLFFGFIFILLRPLPAQDNEGVEFTMTTSTSCFSDIPVIVRPQMNIGGERAYHQMIKKPVENLMADLSRFVDGSSYGLLFRNADKLYRDFCAFPKFYNAEKEKYSWILSNIISSIHEGTRDTTIIDYLKTAGIDFQRDDLLKRKCIIDGIYCILTDIDELCSTYSEKIENTSRHMSLLAIDGAVQTLENMETFYSAHSFVLQGIYEHELARIGEAKSLSFLDDLITDDAYFRMQEGRQKFIAIAAITDVLKKYQRKKDLYELMDSCLKGDSASKEIRVFHNPLWQVNAAMLQKAMAKPRPMKWAKSALLPDSSGNDLE